MATGIRGLEINKLGGKSRPLLNEGEARFRPVAHQLLDRAFGCNLALVRNDHAQKRAAARVHGCFLELARHHFAQAFEPADLDIGLAFELGAHQLMRTEFKGKSNIEIGRFKGLGEMMPGQLKETTMDPRRRTLLRVVIPDEGKIAAESAVEQLMGNRPEARFAFIQERAAFATELVDL